MGNSFTCPALRGEGSHDIANLRILTAYAAWIGRPPSQDSIQAFRISFALVFVADVGRDFLGVLEIVAGAVRRHRPIEDARQLLVLRGRRILRLAALGVDAPRRLRGRVMEVEELLRRGQAAVAL